MQQDITYDTLSKMFTILPELGVVKWNIRNSKRIHIGDDAGCKSKAGYIMIRINKKLYYRHRIIFFYQNGYWPTIIDHINGIPGDDRIDNLRECTQGVNCRNLKSHRENPYVGITINQGKNKTTYTARIRIDGTYNRLGTFDTIDEAVSAYKQAHHCSMNNF